MYRIQQVSSGRFLDAHEIPQLDFRVVTRQFQDNFTQVWILYDRGAISSRFNRPVASGTSRHISIRQRASRLLPDLGDSETMHSCGGSRERDLKSPLENTLPSIYLSNTRYVLAHSIQYLNTPSTYRKHQTITEKSYRQWNYSKIWYYCDYCDSLSTAFCFHLWITQWYPLLLKQHSYHILKMF
jgi:hypothetical protein